VSVASAEPLMLPVATTTTLNSSCLLAETPNLEFVE
jgi:hypothetical protein